MVYLLWLYLIWVCHFFLYIFFSWIPCVVQECFIIFQDSSLIEWLCHFAAKALELFLQDLCDRTYDITLQRGVKTMNSLHLWVSYIMLTMFKAVLCFSTSTLQRINCLLFLQCYIFFYVTLHLPIHPPNSHEKILSVRLNTEFRATK